MLDNGQIIEATTLVKNLEKNTRESSCLSSLGEVYLRKGNTDKAMELFEKALNTANSNPDKATALNKLALASWNLGNLNEALRYMSLSLDIRKQENNPELLAAAYNDYGLVLSNENPEKALDSYTKALKIYEQNPNTDKEKLAQIKINTGVIYRNMEFYGDATVNLDEALKLAQTNQPEGSSTEAFILYNLGLTYELIGNMESAFSFYEKALKLYQKLYKDKHPDIARTYNRLGNTVNREGKFEEALNYYQKALIANSTQFENENIEYNPEVRTFINANTLLNTLYFKAQALEDYHFNFSLDFKDLKLSLSTLYSCDSLIDQIRKIATNESDKVAISDFSAQVYENGVRICYAMGDLSFKKTEYFEQAFYFAEKSKSAVLLQAISDASAKSFAKIPISELEKEENFKNEIAFYERKLAERMLENEGDLRKQLFELQNNYEAFVKQLEANYPEYYNLKYNVSIPTVSQLQKQLDEETAILSYFIADATERLYVFEITDNKFSVELVKQGENFDRYLNGLKNSIFFKYDVVYRMTANALFDQLFPSGIPKNKSRIIVIPAGRLGTIPFETLLTSKTKDKNFSFSTLPYLINEVSISYQYASALLYQNMMAPTKVTQQKALLCAPVQFVTMNDLPGSGEEVQALQGILGNRGVQTDVLKEMQATEQEFKAKNLSDYQYLHFATHGIVNEFKPELSRIFLRESSGDPEDGSLYSGEIFNLNLNAGLVTLSACETGLGKISKGEGIIGLSRALVYAGAENIVVSLWQVADQSTSDLMTDFYQQLGAEDYSVALRKAKLNLLQTEYSHPFYWAPFILIGN